MTETGSRPSRGGAEQKFVSVEEILGATTRQIIDVLLQEDGQPNEGEVKAAKKQVQRIEQNLKNDKGVEREEASDEELRVNKGELVQTFVAALRAESSEDDDEKIDTNQVTLSKQQVAALLLALSEDLKQDPYLNQSNSVIKATLYSILLKGLVDSKEKDETSSNIEINFDDSLQTLLEEDGQGDEVTLQDLRQKAHNSILEFKAKAMELGAGGVSEEEASTLQRQVEEALQTRHGGEETKDVEGGEGEDVTQQRLEELAESLKEEGGAPRDVVDRVRDAYKFFREQEDEQPRGIKGKFGRFFKNVLDILTGEKFKGGKWGKFKFVLYNVFKFSTLALLGIASPWWMLAGTGFLAAANLLNAGYKYSEKRRAFLESINDEELKQKFEKKFGLKWYDFILPAGLGGLGGAFAFALGAGIVGFPGTVAGILTSIMGYAIYRFAYKYTTEARHKKTIEEFKNEAKGLVAEAVKNSKKSIIETLAGENSWFFTKGEGTEGENVEQYTLKNSSLAPALKSIVAVLLTAPEQVLNEKLGEASEEQEQKSVGELLKSIYAKLSSGESQFNNEEIQSIQVVLEKLYEVGLNGSGQDRQIALNILDSVQVLISSSYSIYAYHYISGIEDEAERQEFVDLISDIEVKDDEDLQRVLDKLINNLQRAYGLETSEAKNLVGDFSDDGKIGKLNYWKLIEFISKNWDKIQPNQEQFNAYIDLLYNLERVNVLLRSNLARRLQSQSTQQGQGQLGTQQQEGQSEETRLRVLVNTYSALTQFSASYYEAGVKAAESLEKARIFGELRQLETQLDEILTHARRVMDSVYAFGAILGRVGSKYIYQSIHDTLAQTSEHAKEFVREASQVGKDKLQTADFSHIATKLDENSLRSLGFTNVTDVLEEHHISHTAAEMFNNHLGNESHLAFVGDNGHLYVAFDNGTGTNHDWILKDYGSINEISKALQSLQDVGSSAAHMGTSAAHETVSSNIDHLKHVNIDLKHIMDNVKGHDLTVTPYGGASHRAYIPNLPQGSIYQYMAEHLSSLPKPEQEAFHGVLKKMAMLTGWTGNEDRAWSVLSLKIALALQEHGGSMDAHSLAQYLIQHSPVVDTAARAQFGNEHAVDGLAQILAHMMGGNAAQVSGVESTLVSGGLGAQSPESLAGLFEKDLGVKISGLLGDGSVISWKHFFENNPDMVDSLKHIPDFSEIFKDVSNTGATPLEEMVKQMSPEERELWMHLLPSEKEVDVATKLTGLYYSASLGSAVGTVGGWLAGFGLFKSAEWWANRRSGSRTERRRTRTVPERIVLEDRELSEEEKKLLPEVLKILDKELLWWRLPGEDNTASLGIAKQYGVLNLPNKQIRAYFGVVKHTASSAGADNDDSSTTQAQTSTLTPVLIVEENSRYRILPIKPDKLKDRADLTDYIVKTREGLVISGAQNSKLTTVFERIQDRLNRDGEEVDLSEVRAHVRTAGGWLSSIADELSKAKVGRLGRVGLPLKKERIAARRALLEKILFTDTTAKVESWKTEWDSERVLGKIKKVFGEKIEWDARNPGTFHDITDANSNVIGRYTIYTEDDADEVPEIMQPLLEITNLGFGIIPAGDENSPDIGFYFIPTVKGLIILNAYPVEQVEGQDESRHLRVRFKVNTKSPFREVVGLEGRLLGRDSQNSIRTQLMEFDIPEDKLDNWIGHLMAFEQLTGAPASRLLDRNNLKIEDDRIIVFSGESMKSVSGDDPGNLSSGGGNGKPPGAAGGSSENLGGNASKVVNELIELLREILASEDSELNESDKEKIINFFIRLVNRDQEGKRFKKDFNKLSTAELYIKRHGGECSVDKPLGCWQKQLEMAIGGILLNVNLVSLEVDGDDYKFVLNRNKSIQDLVLGLYSVFLQYINASDSYRNNVFSRAVFVNVIAKLLKDGEYTITEVGNLITKDDGQQDVSLLHERYLENLKQYFIESFKAAGFEEESIEGLFKDGIKDENLIYTSGGIILNLSEGSQVSYRRAGSDSPILIPIELVEYFVDRKPKRQVKRVVRIRIPEGEVDSMVNNLLNIFAVPIQQFDAFKNALKKTRIIRIERRQNGSWSLRIEGSDFDVGFNG